MDGARPAGFWVRVAAALIDCVVIVIARASFRLVAMRMWRGSLDDWMLLEGMLLLITLVFAGLYLTLLHAAAGQTVGKLLVRIRVVLDDGSAVPFGVAFVRMLGYGLSSFPFGFGYLMAALRRDKRALHDLIAGTRVERLPARLPAGRPAVLLPPTA